MYAYRICIALRFGNWYDNKIIPTNSNTYRRNSQSNEPISNLMATDQYYESNTHELGRSVLYRSRAPQNLSRPSPRHIQFHQNRNFAPRARNPIADPRRCVDRRRRDALEDRVWKSASYFNLQHIRDHETHGSPIHTRKLDP